MPQSLESAILLPVPRIRPPPDHASKGERLQTILQNLDAHHGRVRANILKQARTELTELRERQRRFPTPTAETTKLTEPAGTASGTAATSFTTHANANVNPRVSSDLSSDAMDLDTPSPPPVPAPSTLPRNPSPSEIRFLANLNAAYVPNSGDPCVNEENPLRPRTGTRRTRSPAPEEIQILKRGFEHLERYERRARRARGFYEAAGERHGRGEREKGEKEEKTEKEVEKGAGQGGKGIAGATANRRSSHGTIAEQRRGRGRSEERGRGRERERVDRGPGDRVEGERERGREPDRGAEGSRPRSRMEGVEYSNSNPNPQPVVKGPGTKTTTAEELGAGFPTTRRGSTPGIASRGHTPRAPVARMTAVGDVIVPTGPKSMLPAPGPSSSTTPARSNMDASRDPRRRR